MVAKNALFGRLANFSSHFIITQTQLKIIVIFLNN